MRLLFVALAVGSSQKNKPGIVDRLDSKSLSGDGEVFEFTGKRNPEKLLCALDHLRTFRSTGMPIIRRNAKFDPPPPPNVAPVDPEDAVLMEPGCVDIAAARHSAGSAPQPAQSTGIARGHDMRPVYSEDAPVVLGLEEALVKAGTRRLDIAAAQHSACSALQPAQSRGIVVTGADMRPLYFEDARDISRLQEARLHQGRDGKNLHQPCRFSS
ncbi:hypothetical protein H8A95_35990 [Bradyrhizobium sp. Pear76]|uniref:hypothetical protein n=1 Tax=Bradyrhizobium oropedii TaxID=1571201 RepID=UPI001E61AECD|nr:hypothetical protein [Bradyrhizobium oropedii]MCC8967575.1 hypothetical protein [Bradyrhizobium oropedii]